MIRNAHTNVVRKFAKRIELGGLFEGGRRLTVN
jgi:hypothetical protein